MSLVLLHGSLCDGHGVPRTPQVVVQACSASFGPCCDKSRKGQQKTWNGDRVSISNTDMTICSKSLVQA